MAKNKEYQVKVTSNTGITKFSTLSYERAESEYKRKLDFYDLYSICYGNITIELIEILNDDESITLKSHSYGKK